MKRLNFARKVRFSSHQMFDLVADLKSYPDFVPNCADMKISAGPDGETLARMTVSFGPITQAYTSTVRLDREAGRIAASASDGPFSRLESEWRIDPDGAGSEILFEVEFEIANPLVAVVAEPAFAQKQAEIIEAFLSEAERRYG